MQPRRLLALPLLLLPLLVLPACSATELAAKDAELDMLRAELDAAKASNEAANIRAESTKATLDAKASELDEVSTKLDDKDKTITALEGAKGELEGQVEQQQAALDKIKDLTETLAKSLVEEMQTGDIRVSQRGGYLVVNVSDKVLFAIGEAELSERGKKVITKLAESLVALPEQSVFQVGGHTDNQPIKSEKVLAAYPTNWELSAARATNVVRFLEETCEVPGERLVAAGFSQFRPVAKNSKPKSRAKNRRIEIALLPPRD